MAKLSFVRGATSFVAAFVLIFSVLALQTAAHVAQIDKLCAVEVSLVDGEQTPDNSLDDDGGFDAALLERATALAPNPVSAVQYRVPNCRVILHSSILGIPTTGPPAFRT
jgi:hypothetical protein